MPTTLITGAGRGLGLEFTRQYLADGWRVHALARTASPALKDTATGSGGRLNIHRIDVEDLAAIRGLAQELAGTPIDLLLNNAGTMGSQGSGASRFGTTDYESWLTTFKVNVEAPLAFAEAFVEHVAASDGKKIATLSSKMGSMGDNRLGGWYAYRSTKAGVNAVVKSLALDLAKRGIVVLALHPGWVRTDMGGKGATLEPPASVAGMRQVIARAGAADSGRFLQYDGAEIPW